MSLVKQSMTSPHTVVLSIVVLLLAGCKAQTPEVTKARNHMKLLQTAVLVLEASCGVFPSREQGLRALIDNPGLDSWEGPYIEQASLLTDPWGSPYRYSSLLDGFEIASAGPDAHFGSGDDLTETWHRRRKD